MDEMRLIRDFRADINDQGGEPEAEARRRLLDTITGRQGKKAPGFLRLPLAAGVAAVAIGAALIVPQLGGGDGATEAQAA
ncbi:MAG TPA: hypothetical protein VFZ12_09315, partial [Dehalococcoidia bacterium]|nr:hypothetical protein [Dehalococcoidia bacterium]